MYRISPSTVGYFFFLMRFLEGYSVQYFHQLLVTVRRYGDGHDQGVHYPDEEGLAGEPLEPTCINFLQ